MTCNKLCSDWPNCECASGARGWRDPDWADGADRPHTWHAYRWDPDRKVGTSLCGQWDVDEHDHAPFHEPPEGVRVCKRCQRIFAAVAKIAAAKVYAKTTEVLR